MNKLSQDDLVESFTTMGVCEGDTILIRADLSVVGRIEGRAQAFISALLRSVGDDGTIISLAFTTSSFIKKPRIEDAFDVNKKSYAGALPNAMLSYKGAFRSRHPMCSYVAVGRHAEAITKFHDETSPAYEPIREILKLGGKCMLVGCVGSSPGFTTTHLAETDLGLLSLSVFPKLTSTYYKLPDGHLELFRRKDTGLCSSSFYKFYALYVKNEILTTGFIGKAYSIIASAKSAYEIDHSMLKADPKFNICDSKLCFTCNAGRWDRIHRAPIYLLRKIISEVKK